MMLYAKKQRHKPGQQGSISFVNIFVLQILRARLCGLNTKAFIFLMKLRILIFGAILIASNSSSAHAKPTVTVTPSSDTPPTSATSQPTGNNQLSCGNSSTYQAAISNKINAALDTKPTIGIFNPSGSAVDSAYVPGLGTFSASASGSFNVNISSPQVAVTLNQTSCTQSPYAAAGNVTLTLNVPLNAYAAWSWDVGFADSLGSINIGNSSTTNIAAVQNISVVANGTYSIGNTTESGTYRSYVNNINFTNCQVSATGVKVLGVNDTGAILNKALNSPQVSSKVCSALNAKL